MQFSWRVVAPFFLFFSGALSPAVADQALLADGSLLVGEIQQVSEGILTIETAVGVLAVPWDLVVGLNTAEGTRVQLADGDPVEGILNSVDGQQFVIGPDAGEIPVALSDVVALARVPAEVDGEDTVPEAVATPEPAQDAAAAPPLWTGRTELGVNGQTGNKDRLDVRLGINLNRKTDTKRLNLYLRGQYAETNSEKSANEILGGTRVEVDFSDRTYVFAKVDLEYDEFEDLDLRTTVTAGLGHFFVKRDKIELKGWLGGGYEHEIFTRKAAPLPRPTTTEELVRQTVIRSLRDSSETITQSEAVVEAGYSYRHDFKQNFRFSHGATYYPAIGDPFGDYRLAADTTLEFPLGKTPDWTLRTGMRHDYNARPLENIDKLDTTYYLNLGYNW